MNSPIFCFKSPIKPDHLSYAYFLCLNSPLLFYFFLCGARDWIQVFLIRSTCFSTQPHTLSWSFLKHLYFLFGFEACAPLCSAQEWPLVELRGSSAVTHLNPWTLSHINTVTFDNYVPEVGTYFGISSNLVLKSTAFQPQHHFFFFLLIESLPCSVHV